MTHPNADLLRKNDEAMESGDLETFFGHYTDDVVLHLGGTSSLAGDHKGKDQMQELFGKFMEAAGNYSFRNHAYLADDEHGVVLQEGTFDKDGRTLTVRETFVMHFRDGKISEMWYFADDQAAVDAFIG
jgi:hypothetical protein